jgi:hypothetical protein
VELSGRQKQVGAYRNQLDAVSLLAFDRGRWFSTLALVALRSGHFFVTTHERHAMDPNATWQMLCNYLRALKEHPEDEELRANVLELLGALARWLRRGGFPPTLA